MKNIQIFITCGNFRDFILKKCFFKLQLPLLPVKAGEFRFFLNASQDCKRNTPQNLGRFSLWIVFQLEPMLFLPLILICFTKTDVHGTVDISLRWLHQGSRGDVQQLPSVWHRAPPYNGDGGLCRSEVCQQVRYHRPRLRDSLHHCGLRRNFRQLQWNWEPEVSFY